MSDAVAIALIVFGVIAFIGFVSFLSDAFFGIKPDQAKLKIESLLGMNVHILEHTNSSWLTGNPHKIIYVVQTIGNGAVNTSQKYTVVCERHIFQPLICYQKQ